MMNDEPRDGLAAANRLLLAVAEDEHRLGDDELRFALEQVAQAGFQSVTLERAGGRLRDVTWQGRILSARDTLPSAEAHYLRHVVVQQEWPVGLTLAEYIESIRDVIRDPASGAALSLLSGEWQLTIVRRSGTLRGPQGHEWLMVDYRVSMGSWMTAYQMRRGLPEVMRSAHRQGIRWLRHPH